MPTLLLGVLLHASHSAAQKSLEYYKTPRTRVLVLGLTRLVGLKAAEFRVPPSGFKHVLCRILGFTAFVGRVNPKP